MPGGFLEEETSQRENQVQLSKSPQARESTVPSNHTKSSVLKSHKHLNNCLKRYSLTQEYVFKIPEKHDGKL